MKLILGLGNPGEQYKNNRHNVGHLVVEVLLKRSLPKDFVVKKSSVFMNDSGILVKKLVEQNRAKTSDLWVIHDDLDIALGGYKIQEGKGPKLHNGINSIERELGTDEFWRVRVGVENRQRGVGEPSYAKATEGKDYVLQDFTPEERKTLDKVILEICKKLLTS